jgi:hypothetical protein
LFLCLLVCVLQYSISKMVYSAAFEITLYVCFLVASVGLAFISLNTTTFVISSESALSFSYSLLGSLHLLQESEKILQVYKKSVVCDFLLVQTPLVNIYTTTNRIEPSSSLLPCRRHVYCLVCTCVCVCVYTPFIYTPPYGFILAIRGLFLL